MQFFWLQFRAGPWLRFIPLPVFAAYLFINVTQSRPIVAVVTAAVAAPAVFIAFYPEMDMAQSFGMTRAQAAKVIIWPVLFTAAICGAIALSQRADVVGIVCAATSLALSIFMGLVCLPNGERSDSSESAPLLAGAPSSGGSFEWAVIWRPVLTRAAGFGLVSILIGWLATFIGHDTVRQFVAVIPILVTWYSIIACPGLLPTTASSFGLTRRTWAIRALVVAVVANAVFALVTVGIALLIDAPASAYLAASVIGVAVCAIALSLTPRTEYFAFMVPFLFVLPLRELMDTRNLAFDPDVIRGVEIIAAVGGVAAVVSLLLYLTGRADISSGSRRFFGVE
ncbi:hypothetical protein CGLAUT_11720 [Corynebacterium glaucum]|uniref:hypothetical protein n=1 Tax=Corynebacterium glaucum TaxID=187491 RepID=UPI0025B44381|nr:hypothetical protein [Corynebacterium glaucum]WJZ08796.1 hypothetical protein CGLAUT_11720 [Corynebacterium glaucum]